LHIQAFGGCWTTRGEKANLDAGGDKDKPRKIKGVKLDLTVRFYCLEFRPGVKKPFKPLGLSPKIGKGNNSRGGGPNGEGISCVQHRGPVSLVPRLVGSPA